MPRVFFSALLLFSRDAPMRPQLTYIQYFVEIETSVARTRRTCESELIVARRWVSQHIDRLDSKGQLLLRYTFCSGPRAQLQCNMSPTWRQQRVCRLVGGAPGTSGLRSMRTRGVVAASLQNVLVPLSLSALVRLTPRGSEAPHPLPQ